MSITIWGNAIVLEQFICWDEKCGVTFAFSRDHANTLRATGGSFYCPRGHHLAFGESDITKLRKQVEALQERATWLSNRGDGYKSDAERINRRLVAHRGLVTRLKNRIKSGTCPCCSKKLADLAKHMADEHPNYAKES